jgi:hypothetical protein
MDVIEQPPAYMPLDERSAGVRRAGVDDAGLEAKQ